jgi:hypothetical protein
MGNFSTLFVCTVQVLFKGCPKEMYFLKYNLVSIIMHLVVNWCIIWETARVVNVCRDFV